MPPPETCNETEIARGLGGKKIGSLFGDVILLQCSCLLPEASCDWGWKGEGRAGEEQGLMEACRQHSSGLWPAEQAGVFSLRRRQGAAGATRGGTATARAGRGHRAGPAHRRAGDAGRTRSSRIILIVSATQRSPRLSASPSTACSIPAPGHGIPGAGMLGRALRGIPGRVTFPGPPVPVHSSGAPLCPAGTERAHLGTRTPLLRSPAGTFHIPHVLDRVQH